MAALFLVWHSFESLQGRILVLIKKLRAEQEFDPEAREGLSPKGFLARARALGWTSVLLALLQSLCTAVVTISGIRVTIGLSALAAAGGVYAPAKGWHQDAIRIPMLIFATLGALVNLAVLWWIRRLRNQPSAKWRRREPSKKQRRSVRLQIILALLTLFLVGLETWTHTLVHRKGPPPKSKISQNCLDPGSVGCAQFLFKARMEPLTETGRQFKDPVVSDQDHHISG